MIVMVMVQRVQEVQIITIVISATDSSSIDSNGKQEVDVNNDCSGDGTTCLGNNTT